MAKDSLNQNHDFKKFLEEKRLQYQKIGKVFCPALNEWVVFNAKGFYHLRYHGSGKQRLQKDQRRRMNLLKYAPDVISRSSQIIEKRQKESIKYWKIQESIKDMKITVILRKTGIGPYIFYSIWSE